MNFDGIKITQPVLLEKQHALVQQLSSDTLSQDTITNHAKDFFLKCLAVSLALACADQNEASIYMAIGAIAKLVNCIGIM